MHSNTASGTHQDRGGKLGCTRSREKGREAEIAITALNKRLASFIKSTIQTKKISR
jgi:hypothetical protein